MMRYCVTASGLSGLSPDYSQALCCGVMLARRSAAYASRTSPVVFLSVTGISACLATRFLDNEGQSVLAWRPRFSDRRQPSLPGQEADSRIDRTSTGYL